MPRVPRQYSNSNKLGRIKYEARKLENFEDWIVEAVDYINGFSLLTVFEGKFAEARAREYADIKNSQIGNT